MPRLYEQRYSATNCLTGVIFLDNLGNVADNYFQALAEIAEIINHGTSYQDTIAGILDKVDSFMACESGGILLYDERNQELVLQQPSFGVKVADSQPYRLPVKVEQQYGRGTAVEVFLSRKPYVCNRPAEDKYVRKDIIERLGIYNFLTIPLTLKEKVLGVLHVVNKQGGDFTQSDVLFLNTLGTTIAIILEMTRQQNVSKRLIEIHNLFTAQVLQSQGFGPIIDTLSEVLERPVLLEDRFFKTLQFSFHNSARKSFEMPKIDRDTWLKGLARIYYDKMRQSKQPVWIPDSFDADQNFSRVVVPVLVNNEILGYISVGHTQTEFASFELMALEYAVTICALEFLKQIIAIRAENRVKGNFMQELLTGRLNSQGASDKANIMGYDLNRPCRVIVACPAKPSGDEALRQIYEVTDSFVNSCNPRTMVAMFDGSIVILAANDLSGAAGAGYLLPEDLAQSLVQHVQDIAGIKILLGLGQPTDETRQFQISYQQALIAIRALKDSDKPGHILGFEKLGVFRLLFQARDKEQLIAFASEMLKSIIDYDRANRTFLLQSLRAYLDCNCSVQKTAQKSYLHPNTLIYRLRRIEEISGVDLNSSEERLNLQIALKVREFYKLDSTF